MLVLLLVVTFEAFIRPTNGQAKPLIGFVKKLEKCVVNCI